MLTGSVPRLRGRESRSAEVRPSRLKAWLDDLPQGDQEDSMQQILQALYVQNRTGLDPINRLELMELYRRPVFNLAESLGQLYVTSPFPMTGRQFELASSVQRLMEELANGYKVVANDLITGEATRKHRDEFALSLQRATYTLSAIFLKCCEIYRPYPREAWRQFHQVYRLAESHGVLHHPVAKGRSKEQAETVFISYERGFLIGASDPYQLHQGECASLFELIPKWRGHIRITPWNGAGAGNHPGGFLVNLASDSPPIPLAKVSEAEIEARKSGHYRRVSTLEVIKEVHSIMTALKFSVPESLPGMDSAGGTNADFLKRLGRVLAGVNTVRHSTRSSYDRQVPLCIGMNSIHFFINGQRTFQLSKPEDEAARPVRLAANEEYFDLTDPGVGDAHQPELVRPRSGELAMYESVHRLFTCSVRDQAASGLCVHSREQPGLLVRVGDLVGLQFPTPNQWSVGAVRWLQNPAPSTIEFGIELLSPDFFPVAVARQGDDDNEYQALLLPGSRSLKQPQSLLVPRGACHAGEKLLLTLEPGRGREVTPIRVIERTGSYDQMLVALPGLSSSPAS